MRKYFVFQSTLLLVPHQHAPLSRETPCHRGWVCRWARMKGFMALILKSWNCTMDTFPNTDYCHRTILFAFHDLSNVKTMIDIWIYGYWNRYPDSNSWRFSERWISFHTTIACQCGLQSNCMLISSFNDF